MVDVVETIDSAEEAVGFVVAETAVVFDWLVFHQEGYELGRISLQTYNSPDIMELN